MSEIQNYFTIDDVELTRKRNRKRKRKPVDPTKKSGIWGALHGQPASVQIRTKWFWLMAAVATVNMLRINYLLATIDSQYEYLIGPDQAELVRRILNVALPIGGIVATPLVGVLLDGFSTLTVIVTLTLISAAIEIVNLIPQLTAGVTTAVLLGLFRPFFYTTISDYAAKVFGFDTFGTIYGLIISLSGVLTTVQSVLDSITHFEFKMNPAPVNSLLLGLVIATGTQLALFVRAEAKRAFGSITDVNQHLVPSFTALDREVDAV